MLLDIGFLDDSTRPPVIKLEGLSDQQRAAGEHLKQIHDHLRKNMSTLRLLIERASKGQVTAEQLAVETGDMEMIANYRRFGNLCGQYCQVVNTHHSIEDYHLFPRLAEQGEGFRLIAERLGAEHVVVHELLVRLVAALSAMIESPGESTFNDARTVYEALERVLLSHLGYEEDAMGDALGYFGIM